MFGFSPLLNKLPQHFGISLLEPILIQNPWVQPSGEIRLSQVTGFEHSSYKNKSSTSLATVYTVVAHQKTLSLSPQLTECKWRPISKEVTGWMQSKDKQIFSFTIISLCWHKLSIFSRRIQSFAPSLWRNYELHAITGSMKREVWSVKRRNVFHFLTAILKEVDTYHSTAQLNAIEVTFSCLKCGNSSGFERTCANIDYTIKNFSSFVRK